MHTYGTVQVKHHQVLLNFVLDGGQWGALYPSRLTPGHGGQWGALYPSRLTPGRKVPTTTVPRWLGGPHSRFWAQWWREIFFALIGNRPTAVLHVATHCTVRVARLPR
jgi:hypothetical protein